MAQLLDTIDETARPEVGAPRESGHARRQVPLEVA